MQNVQKDANTDIYQTRYKEGRTMTGYQLLSTATPYMIGFSGKTFYEFDLSGLWTPKNTAPTAPAQLAKQTISFVSDTGITIGVSDDELEEVTKNGYSFMPNYMSKKVEGYLMNTVGDCFDKTPEGGSAATPFRSYFVTEASGLTHPRYITFDGIDSPFTFGDDDDDDPSGDDFGDGDLAFTIHHRTISVISSLRDEADVHIYNVSGLAIANFTIQPGETIDTNIGVAGVYMVRADGGRYQKKLAVR